MAEQIAVPVIVPQRADGDGERPGVYRSADERERRDAALATREGPGRLIGHGRRFWCRRTCSGAGAVDCVSGAVDWGWETIQRYIKKPETFPPMSARVDVLAAARLEHPWIRRTYPNEFQFSQLDVDTDDGQPLPQHLLDPAHGTNAGVPSIMGPSNSGRSDSNAGYIRRAEAPAQVRSRLLRARRDGLHSQRRQGAAASSGPQSPQILQLSGVYPKSLVPDLGIDSVVDLPGEGQSLQDNLFESLSMQATTNDTWAALKYDPALWDEELAMSKVNGTGMGTYWNEATRGVPGDDPSHGHERVVVGDAMDTTVEAGAKAQYTIFKDWAETIRQSSLSSTS
ncbi:Choline dehydrogenase [Mycena kentingensis (nom. inval.)]|nr:Choline dehydrogenase [Mycena kentingensis (nom. inval.)]